MAKRSSRSRRKKIEPRSRAQKIALRYGWLLALGTLLVGAGILVFTYAFASIPLPQEIKLASSAEVYDVNGNLIGTYSDEITRFIIPTDELLKKKPFIGQAVIAAEDRDFYDHGGVSARGILRAGWANLTGGEVQQGGSTITQQYVKNAILQDPERTLTRKFKEAVLAIKLERQRSKQEILGFYLNTIYLGRGAYGVEAASRTYFDKPATKLSLNQAAYFAAIIPAPESYQPDDNPDGAKRRRNSVLDQMVEEGYITETRAEEAKSKPVKLAKGTQQADREKRQRAAYFMEWLRKNFLEEEFPDQELYTGGLKIYTTLDLEMQTAAEETVDAILDQPTDPQAAVVSMTPRGEVRALVGGKDFTNTRKARGFNFATTFPGRQPGSSFKPFTLLAAIEDGISPRSRLSGHSPQFIDDPLCYHNGEPWEVNNYGGSSFGTIDLIQATTNSVNTVYAQLVSEVGPEAVVEILDKFGFNPKYGAEEIEAVCSQALGGALDVTPLEMARAYAGFAGMGEVPHVVPVRYVTDSDGNCLKSWIGKRDCAERENTQPEREVEENSTAVLTQAMETVVQGGTAVNAQIGRPVAGKTGTTQLNQNAWFAGYVPQMATAVWVGYPLEPGPDGRLGTDCGRQAETTEERIEKQNQCAEDDFIPEMRFCSDLELCRPVDGREVTGGFLPAMIWGDYMERAVADMEIVDFPEPVEMPGEVINPSVAPPAPTTGPEESPEPDETESPEPEPTQSQEPSPEPQPSSVPSGPPQPSPTGGGGGGGQGGGGGGDPRKQRNGP